MQETTINLPQNSSASTTHSPKCHVCIVSINIMDYIASCNMSEGSDDVMKNPSTHFVRHRKPQFRQFSICM